MIRKKLYTRPIMIAEQFMADNFCVVCNPKYIDIYQDKIGELKPYPSSTKFYKDENGNHILDASEMQNELTTNSSAASHIGPDHRAFLCWTVSGLEPCWAVEAQNDHQLCLFEINSVIIETILNHS